MVINIKVTGKMGKDQVKEFMNTRMVIFTKENGLRISRKAKADQKWPQAINTKENGLKEKRMVLDSTYLQMAMYTKDNLKTEIDKVKEAIPGLIKVITKVNGSLTK